MTGNPTHKTCFVVMPFGGVSDSYYSQIYEPAIRESGLRAIRADEVFRAGSILQDIVNLIRESTVVLADIAEENRNVHYELGLAHALGKPTVLVAPADLELFFDANQERMLSYSKQDPFWGETLKTDIVRAIRETVEQPEIAIPTAFMHIKPTSVETDEVTYLLRRIEERLVDLAAGSRLTRSSPGNPLREKILSLPEVEREAQRLLQSCEPGQAVDKLVNTGVGRVMAEAAVATAKSRAD